jgi:hypothetical protein
VLGAAFGVLLGEPGRCDGELLPEGESEGELLMGGLLVPDPLEGGVGSPLGGSAPGSPWRGAGCESAGGF